MTELDDLLGGSDAEETEAPQRDNQNKTIREMREAIEAANKARVEVETQLQEYRKREVLRDSGLNDKQTKLFEKAYGKDMSPDALKEFRESLGLEAPQAEAVEESATEEAPVEEVAPTSFRPTDVNAGASRNVKVEWTTAEWNVLRQSDPVKADKVLREGRIVRATVNPGGPSF